MRTLMYRKNSFLRGGFTLTELLVAIALLMIIMVSVATIFSSSGQAVSVGMAITDQNRAMATLAQQLQQDIAGYADKNPFDAGTGMIPVNEPPGPSAPPFLYIRSVSQLGYSDKTAVIPNAAPTQRFRLDSLGFFAKGAYKRQTGSPVNPSNPIGIATDPPVLIDRMAAFTNAFIWYGHLRLPDNNATPNWMDPGAGPAGTNPNNFYANQWILGRRALLLGNVMPIGSLPPGTEGHIWGDGYGAWFHGRWYDLNQRGQTPATGAPGGQWDPQNFAPFGCDSKTSYVNLRQSFPMVVDDGAPLAGTVDNTQQVVSSRYDLAGMNREQSWKDFADIAEEYQDRYITGLSDYREWPWVRRYFAQRHWGSLLESMDIEWSAGAAGTLAGNKRAFAETAAKAVPAVLRSCTSFIVEFAGDYVDQNPDGTLDGGAHPDLSTDDPTTWHFDGVIDFDVINGVRQTHWYGMARDLNGSGSVTVNSGDVTTVLQMRKGRAFMPPPPPAAQPVPFESYASDVNNTWYCEWGWTRDMLCLPATAAYPSPVTFAPKLIRVTVQVNDPSGRVMDDMTRQYVFPVKHN